MTEIRKKLGEAELEIMQVIWDAETAVSSNYILKKLQGLRKWQLSTLMTSLTRLADKGFVSCDRSTGTNLYSWLISEKEYKTGEIHDLWGMPYELDVQRSLKKPVTELRGSRIYMRVTAHSTVEERRKQLDQWYQEQLRQVLPELVEKYESIVGKKVSEWRFRRMKTRWGSCQIQKKRICLNIQLAEMPQECLEYVIVHELTHLYERGHNQRFWGLVDQFYPRWRDVKRKMR